MRKKISAVILSLLMMFSATACSSPKKDESSKVDSSESSVSSSSTESSSSEATAPKELEDKLVIYSTHPESLLQLVADEFTKETNVKVEFINLKGELADRVRAEKANPQADIMYGGASSLFMDMAKEDVFASTTPTWASELDPMFKDANGNWYGTIQTPVMMFYNKDMLTAEQAPKDWSDLAKEEYKGMIVSRDTVSSSIRATLMSLIYQYQKDGKVDEAWTYLSALDKNMKNYYNSGSMQFQAVGKKEAAISFAVLSAITQNQTKNEMPLEIIDAASGSVVITDGVAAIKNAPHPNAAEAFVEFAGSAKIQALLANTENRIPTLKAALTDSPEWMKKEYKVMDVDWSVIAENQNEWLQKFDTEIRDTSKDVAASK
ncbi:MAG: extracellular solute-binding protein [Oscillospiraceae bacterium]